MKNILLVMMTLGIMSCTSQKQLETNNIPFEIGQSSVQSWSGGREESGSGAELKIIISAAIDGMAFEKIYFRGRSLDCELETKEGLSAIHASYSRSETSDLEPDKQGKKIQETFKLQPNEAIIAFKEGDDKIKYVKVSGIKEKSPILYKGRPKNQ